MTTPTAPTHVMTATEKKAAAALASVFGLRMLGLFLILPVMAIYATDYPDYAPWLVGLAIGAYGLTQALLQIPFGMLSDRIGRRPVIVGGLLLFAAGSVVAAMADTLFGVALGRALQGTGAIAAAVLALAADVSREEQRAKVMATIGMCIGLAFALALVLGPALGAHIGLRGLFWLTAVSALLGILILFTALPKVVTRNARRETTPVATELAGLLKQPQLLRLNFGVFVLHACLTAWFVAVPLQLSATGLALSQHAWIYLPALVLSIAIMVPLLIIAARKNAHVSLFRLAIGLLIVAIVMVLFPQTSWLWLAGALVVFFAGFNYLEASLPALLTKLAPAGSKGSASGIYSSFQFGGAFVGGLAGGFFLQQFGQLGIGIFCLLLLVCWGCITLGMQVHSGHKNLAFGLAGLTAESADQLVAEVTRLTGIEEARVVLSEHMAYIKVDQKHYDAQQLQNTLKAYQ